MAFESVTIGNATLYRGDAREILPTLPRGLVVVTDPVWPNCPADLIPGAADPDGLWRETMAALPDPLRLVCVMRSDSDPRFLRHVPETLKFLRVIRLPYVIPGHIARILSGDEYAYWYGPAIRFQKGRQLIPGQSPAAQPANRKSGHPCSRSQAHFDWLVDWTSDEGEVVCDPFMGAGTTGIAAWKNDRAFVGCEIDPRYFDLACERIAKAQAENFKFTRASRIEAPTTQDMFPGEGLGRGPYLKSRLGNGKALDPRKGRGDAGDVGGRRDDGVSDRGGPRQNALHEKLGDLPGQPDGAVVAATPACRQAPVARGVRRGPSTEPFHPVAARPVQIEGL